MFCNGKLIWLQHSKYEVNEYADFVDSFTLNKIVPLKIRICSISDYVCYVNNHLVAFNQYPNFVNEKYVDEINILKELKEGLNEVKIVSLSRNYDTSSHIKDGKGLIFEVFDLDGNSLCASDEDTVSRINPNYQSGQINFVTGQLGMGYHYNFIPKDDEYESSAVIERKITYLPRPIDKLIADEKIKFVYLGNNIFDGSKELTGYLYFVINSDVEQDIEVRYGEHIVDGKVRHLIGNRNFSLKFHLKKGINEFDGYLFRLGLRYIELSSFDGEVKEIGIHYSYYPLKVKKKDFKELNHIVDTSLYTVKCCMHEHYEDCPWREQAQYTMDSRITILINYLAFNETKFPRAALKQMSYDFTNQGVLRITTPSSCELSIPCYSLIYPLMIHEYYQYTKDISLVKELMPKIDQIMNHYLSSLKNDLLPHQKEWNFYEWAEGLDFDKEIFEQKEISNQFDLPLNAFLVIALDNYSKLLDLLGTDSSKYVIQKDRTIRKCRELFKNKDGLYYTYYKDKGYHLSEYANYLAIYSKIVEEKEAKHIIEILINDNNLIPITLCNYIFKYDALLMHGDYIDYIKEDIKRTWGHMDEMGATTYWETIKGENDFAGAGSLCHGWSAVPAYVLYKIYNENYS